MAIDVTCPKCKEKLRIPDDWLGQTVECPACEHSFTAIKDPDSVEPGVVSSGPPPLPPGVAAPPAKAPDVAEDDDEFASPIDEEPEDRDRPRKKRARRRPSKGPGGYFGELQRKQKKMMAPHRGAVVLLLGIFSILCCWTFVLAIGSCACGYYAYQMGSYDLREMQAGRMDPSGKAITQVGRIMGLIGAVLSLLGVLASMCGLLLKLIQAATGIV
jgi:hypothetical protein